ncbi:restriction endonuclease subunit S [Xanthomonas campestris]|uniref:restriction endonuclease subunit S n=1 Tax=Xanthomonas campestris TaxID=339 RepID=UPI0023653D2F|nr:restriction endonuclease subunit S [Xanthomonas campestris]WDJ05179.1 restriction endonuclease subunit S [Xanthomonas campestris pv. incanae]
MSEWRRGKIGDLAKGHRGVTYAAGQLLELHSPDSVTLLRSNNIRFGRLDYDDIQIVPKRLVTETQLMRDGDIAVCMSNGSKSLVGKAAAFFGGGAGKITVGAFCSIFRPEVGCVPEFVRQLFQSGEYRKNLDLALAGSAINNLRNRDLEDFGCDVPPECEQRKIAVILDTLDTAIHETEALIAKLKVVKQGLLHDLLTRGIDANGELRPPQSEAPYLYKPSTLGWIPKEWQDSLAEAEFHIDAGITLGSHRVPRRRPTKYLRVANVYRDRLAIEDVASLEASESEARLKALEVGDLLMVEGHANTSEIGRCAIADERVRGMVFQNHLFRLRCMRLLPEFGLLWLNSDYSQSYWRREAATSSGLNTINRTKLRCLGVALPSSSEQALIASRARAIATRIHCEARILGKLKTERSGLMNDLLTGRVRVAPLLDAATA